MIGDQADMAKRHRAVLPDGWFPDDSPVLDGVLNGLGAIWSWYWSMLDYVARQRRIATATDINLDLIAQDFLGTNLPRRAGEVDAIYRARLKASIFQEQGTRKAIIDALTSLTGRAPVVFEPSNPGDTGGWGRLGMTQGTNLGYGVAGGYGSLELPFQAFVTAFRPASSAPAAVQGYYAQGSVAPAFGGYGVGSLEYVTIASSVISASDQEVYDALEAVKPIGTILWVAITDRVAVSNGGDGVPQTTTPLLDVNFVLDVSHLS